MILSLLGYLVATVCWFCAFHFLYQHLYRADEVPEPPVVPQTLPYLGHVLGIVKSGLRYFDLISARCGHPIFTLHLVNSKTYVITSSELIKEIQCNKRTISFSPAILPAIRRMLGFDDEGMAIISKDAESQSGFFGEMGKIQHSALALGSSTLDHFKNDVRSRLMCSLNKITDDESVQLYAWNQHLFTQSNTAAAFGAQNPFEKYDHLEDAFWDWEGTVKVLVLGLPKMFVWRDHNTAIRARHKLVNAFSEYLSMGFHKDATPLIKELYDLGNRYGVSHENSARSQIGLVLAMISNTIPTSFWLLAYIYSTSGLLVQVRKELDSITLLQCDAAGHETLHLEISRVRERCPILTSSFDEVLRITAGVASIRHISADTSIADGRYLLKKNSAIQMPTTFIHSNPKVWGEDALGFDPCRFMKDKLTKEVFLKRTAAFRPFGGGTALCPGRHFALMEILTFVGTVLVGFDMAPADGGQWRLPEKDRTKIPMASFKPVQDLQVTLKRRQGFGHIQFT